MLLNGAINGSAAAGYTGGSFSLTTGGAVDLDSLAVELAQSGVTESITVDAKAGNLLLSAGNTLTAHVVSLTADGGTGDSADTTTGNITIGGTINASGFAGGEIDLYGKNKVDIEGTLLARACLAGIACDETADPHVLANALNPFERGGTVNIGTTATFVSNTYDPTYGYEEFSASGGIVVGSNALIDVSGGSLGGLGGGTVNFRAPLLADGSVNVTINPFNTGKGIIGSRATTLEAYAVWSTTDGTTGNQHFDGIVDPAGWYDSNGNLVSGTFTDQSGNDALDYTAGSMTAAQLATYLQNDYFTPNTGAADTAHQQFYGYQSTTTDSNGNTVTTPGTLMGFVQTFHVTANGLSNVPNLVLAAGIELDNPSSTINGGNISVLTNWNLGSGSSQSSLDFRTLATGAAPIITFRAQNNVEIDASLSDGFFQVANPISLLFPIPIVANTVSDAQYEATKAYSANDVYGGSLNYFGPSGYVPLLKGPGLLTSTNPSDASGVEGYYALYTGYLEYLTLKAPPSIAAAAGLGSNATYLDVMWYLGLFSGGATGALTPPSAPSDAQQASNPASYLTYLSQYITNYVDVAIKTYGPFTGIVPPAAPTVQLDGIVPAGTIIGKLVVDNTPAPAVTAANPFPLLTASLANEASSAFRLAAGADLNGANPLALRPSSAFTGTDGSVTLDGHFSYVDQSNETINAPDHDPHRHRLHRRCRCQ